MIITVIMIIIMMMMIIIIIIKTGIFQRGHLSFGITDNEGEQRKVIWITGYGCKELPFNLE